MEDLPCATHDQYPHAQDGCTENLDKVFRLLGRMFFIAVSCFNFLDALREWIESSIEKGVKCNRISFDPSSSRMMQQLKLYSNVIVYGLNHWFYLSLIGSGSILRGQRDCELNVQDTEDVDIQVKLLSVCLSWRHRHTGAQSKSLSSTVSILGTVGTLCRW